MSKKGHKKVNKLVRTNERTAVVGLGKKPLVSCECHRQFPRVDRNHALFSKSFFVVDRFFFCRGKLAPTLERIDCEVEMLCNTGRAYGITCVSASPF